MILRGFSPAGEGIMQIASFILVQDRALRELERQMTLVFKEGTAPQTVFVNLVAQRLQDMGAEHPISIPLSTLFPLDQAAERQHEQLLSAFEDPARPSELGRMALAANVPIYYVPPGRVRAFARELERLRLAVQLHPEDVQTLLGKRVRHDELPEVTQLIDQFRHDLYQVYRDAATQGMGVVVLVAKQPEIMAGENDFPNAA